MFIELETFIFAGAIVAIAEMSHFTWWAVAALVVHNVSVIATADHTASPLLISGLTIALIVSITVPCLSAAQCSLFQEALTNTGVAGFAGGNFVLHYWPSLRLVYRFWATRCFGAQGKQTRAPIEFCGVAAQVLMLYCTIYNPSHVYGCPKQLPLAVFLAAGLTLSVGIELLLVHAVSK